MPRHALGVEQQGVGAEDRAALGVRRELGAQRGQRRELLEAGPRMPAAAVARPRRRLEHRLVADVRPVGGREPPAALRVAAEPGGDPRPVRARDRREQPLAAGDPRRDELEAVADVEPLDAARAQEVLVGHDDGAGGAQPRGETRVELQAGRVVQDDRVGAHHRRLRQKRQAEILEGPGDRRVDRPVAEHRRSGGRSPRARPGARARGSRRRRRCRCRRESAGRSGAPPACAPAPPPAAAARSLRPGPSPHAPASPAAGRWRRGPGGQAVRRPSGHAQ